MGDDIASKAGVILRELARMTNEHGIRAYKLTTDDFTQAVGMKWDVIRRVMRYLVDMGWARQPSGVSMILTPKGLAAASAAPAPPRLGQSVVALDFAFVTDAPVRTILERNAIELQKALDNDAWTSSIAMAGAIAEGVIIFGLLARQTRALSSAAIVEKDKARNKGGRSMGPDIKEWKLWFLVEVAGEMGLLDGTTKKMTHGALKDFRNMIHPYVQIRDGLTPDDTAAEGSRLYLHRLVKDIANAPP